MTLTVVLADAADTERLGAKLAGVMRSSVGGVLTLEGPLGAGKTTLARGLLRALGVTGAIRSPTYTLLEPYAAAGLDIIHLDLYRLADADELIGLGVEDYPVSGWWWLVEWPVRGGALVPPATLSVTLSIDGGRRRAQVTAVAPFEALLTAHLSMAR